MNDSKQSSVKATLFESESYESIPNPNQQVGVTVDPISPSANRTFPEENEYDTTQVPFVSSDSNELGGIPPVPSRPEENPTTLITKGVNSPVSMVPISSTSWQALGSPSLVPITHNLWLLTEELINH